MIVHEIPPQRLEAVPSGATSMHVLELPASPARGDVVRACVRQASGTLSGFTAALYNARAAFNTDGTALANDAELYRITPDLTAAGGAAFARTPWDQTFPFGNLDTTIDEETGRYATRRNRVYLALVTGGSTGSSLNFDASLCLVEHD